MGLKTFGATIAAAILTGVILSELKAWAPWAADQLRRLGVRAAPLKLRDRLNEEWGAHLEETPGYFSKIIRSVGFIFAGLKLRFGTFSSGFILVGLSTNTRPSGAGDLDCAVMSKSYGVSAKTSFPYNKLVHNGVEIDKFMLVGITYNISYGEESIFHKTLLLGSAEVSNELKAFTVVMIFLDKRKLLTLSAHKPKLKKGPWNP